MHGILMNEVSRYPLFVSEVADRTPFSILRSPILEFPPLFQLDICPVLQMDVEQITVQVLLPLVCWV